MVKYSVTPTHVAAAVSRAPMAQAQVSAGDGHAGGRGRRSAEEQDNEDDQVVDPEGAADHDNHDGVQLPKSESCASGSSEEPLICGALASQNCREKGNVSGGQDKGVHPAGDDHRQQKKNKWPCDDGAQGGTPTAQLSSKRLRADADKTADA